VRVRFILCVLLVALAGGCAPSHDLSGSVSVFDFEFHSRLVLDQAQRLAGGDFYGLPANERDAVWVDAVDLVRGVPCADGVDAFDDVHTDAPVVVTGTNGLILGETALAGGYVDLLPYPDVQAGVLAVCRFEFDIPELANADVYTIRIGTDHSFTVPYPADRTVSLEIGVSR
jgi:hypothetical protein